MTDKKRSMLALLSLNLRHELRLVEADLLRRPARSVRRLEEALDAAARTLARLESPRTRR